MASRDSLAPWRKNSSAIAASATPPAIPAQMPRAGTMEAIPTVDSSMSR